MTKHTISAVVQTYNEAPQLEETLRSLVDFDQIVVCDMYSSDDTVKIAEKYGAKVVYHKHMKICEPARNFATSAADSEWVLVVDADETITPQLREHLYKLAGRDDIDGAFIPRKNFFMGRFMHNLYPDYILRFLRKGRFDWPSTIHATPQVEGTVIHLPRNRKELAIIHRNDLGLEAFLEKANRYTSLEVQRRAGKRRNYSLFYTSLSALLVFFKEYFIKGGIRDGRAGFAGAVYSMFYKFVTMTKLWAKEAKEKAGEN